VASDTKRKPPLLDSAKWAADYIEVKALGAATGSIRTPDQTEIALFWAAGAGTESRRAIGIISRRTSALPWATRWSKTPACLPS